MTLCREVVATLSVGDIPILPTAMMNSPFYFYFYFYFSGNFQQLLLFVHKSLFYVMPDLLLFTLASLFYGRVVAPERSDTVRDFRELR
jgi:hypothetical protein